MRADCCFPIIDLCFGSRSSMVDNDVPLPAPPILRSASPARVGDLICVLVEESCLRSIFNHQDNNKGRHGRNSDEQREHTFSLFSPWIVILSKLGGLMLGFTSPFWNFDADQRAVSPQVFKVTVSICYVVIWTVSRKQ